MSVLMSALLAVVLVAQFRTRVVTSVLFLAVVLGLVVYLGVTRKDVIAPEPAVRRSR